MRMKKFVAPAWLQPALDWGHVIAQNMTAKERSFLGLLFVILVVSSVWSIVGFVQRNSHLIPQAGGSYTEAAVGQPRNINPILAGANDLDLDLTNLVYSSLFKLDNNFELQPELATGYEVSDNQLEYTIHLRANVLWHDGQPLTADDVVFTIRSIQTPDYGSPLESAFQGVVVEKVDDQTVVFRLKQPYAPFLTSLTVGIVPKHVWENIPPKNASLAEQMLKPVGTGPFQFAELVTRRRTGEITSFRLTRNDNFFGERPYLDEITFVFYPTHEEAAQALLSGKTDGVGFLALSNTERFRNRASLTIRRLLLPQYFGLFFNEIKNERLGDAGIRSALALATDRETIVESALGKEAQPLQVPMPRGKSNLDEEIELPAYDPETAKQNLEEAGWKDTDGDGIREKGDAKLEFTITTTDWPEFVRTAELIKEQWGKIGVSVNIASFGAGEIQQTIVAPREYQILLYGEILATDPDPYPFWHSTQTRSPGLNLSLLKNTKIDKILEEARKTSDINQRQEKYLEFQKVFLDLNPAIILYQPYYLFAHNNSVRGMTIDRVNLPMGRLNDISKWHVKVKRVWNSS